MGVDGYKISRRQFTPTVKLGEEVLGYNLAGKNSFKVYKPDGGIASGQKPENLWNNTWGNWK